MHWFWSTLWIGLLQNWLRLLPIYVLVLSQMGYDYFQFMDGSSPKWGKITTKSTMDMQMHGYVLTVLLLSCAAVILCVCYLVLLLSGAALILCGAAWMISHGCIALNAHGCIALNAHGCIALNALDRSENTWNSLGLVWPRYRSALVWQPNCSC